MGDHITMSEVQDSKETNLEIKSNSCADAAQVQPEENFSDSDSWDFLFSKPEEHKRNIEMPVDSILKQPVANQQSIDDGAVANKSRKTTIISKTNCSSFKKIEDCTSN